MQYFVEIFDNDKKRLNMKCCFKCDVKTPLELAVMNSHIDVVSMYSNLGGQHEDKSEMLDNKQYIKQIMEIEIEQKSIKVKC